MSLLWCHLLLPFVGMTSSEGAAHVCTPRTTSISHRLYIVVARGSMGARSSFPTYLEPGATVACKQAHCLSTSTAHVRVSEESCQHEASVVMFMLHLFYRLYGFSMVTTQCRVIFIQHETACLRGQRLSQIGQSSASTSSRF